MDDKQTEAERLIKTGEKELKKWLFCDKDRALDCFKKAANIYKLLSTEDMGNHMVKLAAETFIKCADAAEYDYEKMSFYENALNLYKKIPDPWPGTKYDYYSVLITNFYLNQGEFKRACRYIIELADFQVTGKRYDLAETNYQKALRLNDDEYFINKTLNKLVELYIEIENYSKAIETLEELIDASLTVRYRRSELMLTLVLCCCCLRDNVKIKRALEPGQGSGVDDKNFEIAKCIEENDYKTFEKIYKNEKMTVIQRKLMDVIREGFKKEDDLC